MRKLQSFILILSFLPTQSIITNPLLWISPPTFNVLNFMTLNQYQKESLAIKDMIDQINFANPQDKIIELTKIEHKIAALESFKGFNNPHATNGDHLETLTRGSLHSGIILIGAGIEIYQYLHNQPAHRWLAWAKLINIVTLLPTQINQTSALLQYNKAKKESISFTASNIQDILTKKVNASLIAKINQEKCDIDRSSFRNLQKWRNLTPYRASENRPSITPAKNKTINALSQINIMRSRENKKNLPKDPCLLIKDFVGTDPWQPRSLTYEEQSHIGTLPEEFYQRFLQDPAASNL